MIDIDSRAPWPSCDLSNFAKHTFIVDDVICYSMEGFLQSLKFKNPGIQRQICRLAGKEAKHIGRNIPWWESQTLYWQGVEIERHSQEYQQLLDKAYEALSFNPFFQYALLETLGNDLDHTIGVDDPYRTVLTRQEFIGRLIETRQRLLNQTETVV